MKLGSQNRSPRPTGSFIKIIKSPAQGLFKSVQGGPQNKLNNTCSSRKGYFCQLILLFNLFLSLFMNLAILFDTIHWSYCIITANFYLYLLYFKAKFSILVK